MNWSAVERLFAVALETPPEHRDALLDSNGLDATVRVEVRRLLARHAALSSPDDAGRAFLDALDLGRAAALVDAAEAADPERVGHYEIVRRLGRGATGIVYLARDPVLGRNVALKLLSPSLSADPSAAGRFAEEARAASALDHPHIATVYEFGRAEDERFFIVMAYHEGETLRDRLARGALPVAEAIRVAAEIADGLSAAHAEGIVHRDIKPENILMTPRGACIVDFGIAKVLGHTLTRTGAALGTAAYMSPEQSRGVGVDHRSDLWSLGVVLYEMLTGVRPFQADGGEALVYGIRHDVPEPLTARRHDVAPALVQVVERCLEKQPERRYQSASDVLAALRAPMPLPGWAEPLRRRWKRIGLVVGGIAAAAVVVLVAPGRHTPSEPLDQLSTVLPLPPHPGAIAILSLSDGPSWEPNEGRQYLTAGMIDGIHDELTRGLSGTPGIRVTWRPSVVILAEAGADVQAMGRRLGVIAILKWTLRHSDGLVTVAAELVRASDGRELWSHVYERPVGEVGAIPEEIRRSVAGALGLGRADSAEARRGASDLVAYDLYLRGRFAGSKGTPSGFEEADLLFRQAIARDSSFALAYISLADVYRRTWPGAPADRLAQVKPLVAKALEMDSTLAYAHRLAGYVAMWQDRDWAAAERHLSRALALDSSDTWTYLSFGDYFAATGRTDEGLAMTRRATALDPVGSATATHVGLHLFWRRQYAEAIAVLERALQADTVWWQSQGIVLGRAYLAVGRYDEAIRLFRRAGLRSAVGFEAPALLAYGLGIAGRTQEARAVGAQYMVWGPRASSARPLDLVAVHLGLGNIAEALDWVEQIPGVEQIPDDRGSTYFLLSDPMFDPLRDSPRFLRVLEQLGLSEAAKRASRR